MKNDVELDVVGGYVSCLKYGGWRCGGNGGRCNAQAANLWREEHIPSCC